VTSHEVLCDQLLLQLEKGASGEAVKEEIGTVGVIQIVGERKRTERKKGGRGRCDRSHHELWES